MRPDLDVPGELIKPGAANRVLCFFVMLELEFGTCRPGGAAFVSDVEHDPAVTTCGDVIVELQVEPGAWDRGSRSTPHRATCRTSSPSSAMRGGLPTMASTSTGAWPSSRIIVPQPVIMMTGVCGDFALMVRATWRPSTSGMPRSVMTTWNGDSLAMAT